MKSRLTYFPLAILIMSLVSCNGIFSGIYDNAEADDTVGLGDNSFSNIDVTSYTLWTYLNFHDQTMQTAEIDEDGNYTDPDGWDIALHRWDTRTNGGVAMETSFTSLDALLVSGEIPEGEWVEDIWTTDQLIIDMSGMMSGILGYAEGWYNPELSKWIDVNISQMPPLYNLSGKVYLVKFDDGTIMATQLSNYTNAIGDKGYLTIDYIYPLEF